MQRKRTNDNQVAYVLDVLANGADFSESPQKRNKAGKQIKFSDIAKKLKSAFHQAVLLDERDAVRAKLADQSWDVNQTDIHGLTALHIAVMCRHYKMVHVLLNRKASLDILSDDGVSAYELAIRGVGGVYDEDYTAIVELMDQRKNYVKPTTPRIPKVLYRSPEPSQHNPEDVYYIDTVAGKRVVGPGYFFMKIGNNPFDGNSFKQSLELQKTFGKK